MADFRTKLAMLAGAAAMCAGMAHAQNNLSCTAAAAVTSGLVRAESNSDQVGDVVVTCNGGAAGSPAATLTLQVTMSPAATITSASVGSGTNAASEALAGVTTDFANTQKNGTVSGSTVTFSGIAIPALAANATTTVTITNIKIQASAVANSSGPVAIGETIFVSGTNVNGNFLTANNVAIVTNGLGAVKASGTTSNAICNTVTGANTNFSVSFSENFATAFKVRGSVAGNNTLGSWYANNSETGFGYTNANSSNATNVATSGTRVAVTFNNVPANVNVYVPLVIQDSAAGSSGVGTMTLVTSATGARTDATAADTSGTNPPPASYGQVSISNGTGTAVYEYTANDSSSLDTYKVNVSLRAAAGAIAAPSSAITATVNFAPIGASSNVPNFVSGGSTATVNGSTFIACSTTLLFPFVTNQLGFDTGLAISNTSSDLLAKGGTASAAAKQNGTCSLSFFGDTAPAAAVVTGDRKSVV